jgi:hypothetical protein
MPDRRYSDEEVREILELATKEPAANDRSPVGTAGLTLAEIQSIALEAGVAPDAVAVAAARLNAPATTRGSWWRMPVSVGRTVALPRPMNAIGAGVLLASPVGIGAAALGGAFAAETLFVPLSLGASGAGLLLANVFRLPRWAEQRHGQMEHIEARVLAMLRAGKSAEQVDRATALHARPLATADQLLFALFSRIWLFLAVSGRFEVHAVFPGRGGLTPNPL